MFRGFVLLAMLAPMAAGCAAQPRAQLAAASVAVEAPAPVTGWRAIASPADEVRVEALTGALRQAHAGVPRRFSAVLAKQGPVVDPGAAQPAPQLPPGSYYCRLLRFGGVQRFRTFTPDFCYVAVEGDGMAFTKQTGTNLPQGYIYPDNDKRQVFLGTMRVSGQTSHGSYGKDPARDLVGVIERVAPFRWRLILSRPGNNATLDMYELVPVPATVPGAKPATQPS